MAAGGTPLPLCQDCCADACDVVTSLPCALATCHACAMQQPRVKSECRCWLTYRRPGRRRIWRKAVGGNSTSGGLTNTPDAGPVADCRGRPMRCQIQILVGAPRFELGTPCTPCK